MLFVPALALAFAVRWLLEYTLALAAFWTTRVAACNSVYHLVFWFLAGMVAPNALLPDWLQAVAAVLPFRWMLAFPIEVLLGRLENRRHRAGATHPMLVARLGLRAAPVRLGDWRAAL